jgi:tRNA G46 methylase TrmB
MKTYQFESIIDENGTIVLPTDMKALTHHRVRLTLVDLDTLQHNPVTLLQEMTQAYTQIVDEADLDIAEIYERREQRNDREALFT